MGKAGGALAGLDADAVAGNRRRLDCAAIERLQDLVARRLQRIDPEVQRRTAGKRLRFGKPVFIEIFLERRLDPFRDIALYVERRIFELAAGKGGGHVLRQRLGREFVAVQFSCQLLWRNAPLAEHDGMAERCRTVAVHQIGMREFHAQRVIDDVADRGTIAGPGETMCKPPILEGIGNGTLARFDIGENLNGSGEPATQSHLSNSIFRRGSGDGRQEQAGRRKPMTNADQMGGCGFRPEDHLVPAKPLSIYPEQIPDRGVLRQLTTR